MKIRKSTCTAFTTPDPRIAREICGQFAEHLGRLVFDGVDIPAK